MGNAQYCPNANVRSNHLKNYKLNWNGANLTSYANTVSQLLARIAIPSDILLCKGKSNGSVTMSLAEQSGCADHDAHSLTHCCA